MENKRYTNMMRNIEKIIETNNEYVKYEYIKKLRAGEEKAHLHYLLSPTEVEAQQKKQVDYEKAVSNTKLAEDQHFDIDRIRLQ